MNSFDHRLRRLPVVLVGATLVGLATTAAAGFAPAVRTRLGWTAVERPAYAVGDVIDIPAGLRDQADRTLVVFASGTCGASLRSAGVLRRVASDLRRVHGQFVVITPKDQRADQQKLAESYGLEPSEVTALDLRQLRLKYVPTVVVVDRAGNVRYVREGAVDDDGRVAIQRALALGQS
ncbi:MAG: hypothetical protein ABI634_02160 [Acidobacteriota bacterium]